MNLVPGLINWNILCDMCEHFLSTCESSSRPVQIFFSVAFGPSTVSVQFPYSDLQVKSFFKMKYILCFLIAVCLSQVNCGVGFVINTNCYKIASAFDLF